MKRCTKCGVEKDESEFGVQTKGANGLRSSCKQCTNKDNAERYQRNKDKWKPARLAWRVNNPDKFREYSKVYNEKDPERIAAMRRARFARNREHNYEQTRLWRIANPEAYRAIYTRWKNSNPEKVATYIARKNLSRALGFTPPEQLVEAKAMQYLINRVIKEKSK